MKLFFIKLPRVMGFIDPMPTGDVTVRLQMDKKVKSSNNVTIDAWIGLPDLKIGLYLLFFARHRSGLTCRWSS